MKLWQWLKVLFAALRNGRAQTSPKSSLPSSTSSTNAPSIKPKPSGPRFKEKQLNTPNVSAGRRITPKAVVLHHTAGSYAGSVAWCMDPASKVSYHCIVAKDGRRTVLADPDERTWHAGKSEWHGRKDLNSWSIGASFEGDTNTEPLTLAAMESMAEYLVPIMRQYGLELPDVTDHRTVAPGRKDDLAWRELERFKAYLARRIQNAP